MPCQSTSPSKRTPPSVANDAQTKLSSSPGSWRHRHRTAPTNGCRAVDRSRTIGWTGGAPMIRRKHRSAALAAALALLLFAAPLARALPAACDRCPADCPMHGKAHLPCHQAPMAGAHSSQAAKHECGAGSSMIGAPGCGHAHGVPTVIIAPAALPIRVAVESPHLRACALLAVKLARARGDDPPATPPPITLA